MTLTRKRMQTINLKTIFLFCVSIGLTIALAGCSAVTSTPTVTAIATPAVSRDKAIELATAECKKGHLVLVGNPATAEAALMTLGEADAAVRSAGETTNYGLPAASKVWLVQLTGSFQVIGGPQGLLGASPTTSPPQTRFCKVIVEADKEHALGVHN